MTVRENMLPSAMVPGLVTVECTKSSEGGPKKGDRQNIYPVDAKERINQGDWKLVENGAVEASRLAATPLRSGMASNLAADHIVAEVSGIEGRVVMADSAEEADRIREAGDNADRVQPKAGTASKPANQADEAAAGKSAAQPKTEAEKAAAGADKK
jgi:hypothetical protein